jgi:hypothetical protein
MEVCDVWLARDFLRRARRPLDIPPCQHRADLCPPIRERNTEMTTTPTTALDLDELLEAHASAHHDYWMSEDNSPGETDAKQRREEAAAAIREQFANVEDALAKTRAELDEAKAALDKVRAETLLWAADRIDPGVTANWPMPRSETWETALSAHRGTAARLRLWATTTATEPQADDEPFDCAPECRCKPTKPEPAQS